MLAPASVLQGMSLKSSSPSTFRQAEQLLVWVLHDFVFQATVKKAGFCMSSQDEWYSVPACSKSKSKIGSSTDC